MKNLTRNNHGVARLALALAALTSGSCLVLSAGEPIIFSGEKPKAAATRAERYGNESPKSWGIVPPSDGRVVPTRPATVRDPKLERRLQKAREERENWMVVNPGDLQNEDESKEFLGVRGGDKDFLEKEGTKHSIFFDKDASKPKDNNSGRPSSSRPPNAPSRATEQDGKSTDTPGRGKDGESKSRGKSSAHTSSDLALADDLLGPSRESDLGSAAPGLSELFKIDPAVAKAREQKTQRDDFQKFLDNPSGGGPASGLDPGQSRAMAVRPSPSSLDFSPLKSDSSAPVFGKGLETFSRPNVSVDRSSPNGQVDYLGRAGASGAGQYSSQLQPQPSQSLVPRSRSSFDPPTRMGVGGR